MNEINKLNQQVYNTRELRLIAVEVVNEFAYILKRDLAAGATVTPEFITEAADKLKREMR
jgi:hypothetical protein